AVYEARHRLLDERRVIKTIRPQLREDEDLQQRFLREAQVAAKMRHPHIAALHDFAFTEDGTAYIVMEHIEGRNLRDFQRGGGRLSVPQVASIAEQALGALGYLHARRFVHRDISTDNLMIGWEGDAPRVTLIDLGLAKSLEGSDYRTKTGMVVGKVRYISPEQLNSGNEGVEVDARADLYSFGVVLYELLTGELPIVGADDMSLIAGHLYRAPRPFDETDAASDVPSALRTVVMRSLEKRPDYRYESAELMAAAIQEAMRVEPTRAFDVPDHHEQPTVRMPAPRRPGDPHQATETVAGMAQAQATQPAVVPGQPAVTRPAVPQHLSPQAPPEDVDSGARTVITELQVDAPPSASPTRPSSATAPTTAPAPTSPRRGLVFGAVAVAAIVGLAFFWFGRGERVVAPTDGTEPVAEAPATLDDVFWGDYHAVVIGIDTYTKLPDLDMAVADARAVAEVLERRFGFQVTLIENADRITLVDTLYEVASRLDARDNLLVYYAGHGTVTQMTPWWQAADSAPDDVTQWIATQSDVADHLDRLALRHLLVISDSCFAGALGEVDAPPTPSADERVTVIRDRVRRPSRMVLASGGLSPVLDAGGSGRHSIFATALLDALETLDEPIGATELFQQLDAEVAAAADQLGFEQQPVLATLRSRRDEGGELFFVPAPPNASGE
ncbi:MAG: protein kinase, partial [Acidobacteriota bacterium]